VEKRLLDFFAVASEHCQRQGDVQVRHAGKHSGANYDAAVFALVLILVSQQSGRHAGSYACKSLLLAPMHTRTHTYVTQKCTISGTSTHTHANTCTHTHTHTQLRKYINI